MSRAVDNETTCPGLRREGAPEKARVSSTTSSRAKRRSPGFNVNRSPRSRWSPRLGCVRAEVGQTLGLGVLLGALASAEGATLADELMHRVTLLRTSGSIRWLR